MLDMAALSTRLKTQYIPGVEEVLASEYILSANVKKAKNVQVQGNEFVFLTHTGRNEGHGWRAEGEDLPDSGFQRYNQAKIPVSFYYHVGGITGQGLAKAKGPDAYVTELQSELKRVMNDAHREFNIYNWGPQSGVRATVTSVSGTTITCAYTHIPGQYGVNFIRKHMKLTITNSADTAVRNASGAKVIAVSHAARTFTLAAGTDMSGIAADDRIRVFNNWDTFNGSKQCLSMLEAVDDGTRRASYLNIGRTGTNGIPEWQSVTLGDDTAATALTLAQLQNLCTLTDVNAPEQSGLGNNIFITTYGVRDSYFLDIIAAPDRQFVANDRPLKYDAGFGGLDYNGRRWYVDRDCPRGYLFYTNIAKFRQAILDDWDFLKDLKPDSGILVLQSNKDSYKFYMRRYLSGLYTVNPRMSGVRKGIQDSGVSVIN